MMSLISATSFDVTLVGIYTWLLIIEALEIAQWRLDLPLGLVLLFECSDQTYD